MLDKPMSSSEEFRPENEPIFYQDEKEVGILKENMKMHKFLLKTKSKRDEGRIPDPEWRPYQSLSKKKKR
jgi:hypothetical protein